MSDLLATVERLATRLGVTLDPGTADYDRAREALWTASTRARSIAQRPWTNPDDPADPDGPIPDPVVDVVLAAAMRIWRNPDRALTTQTGGFQAGLAQADLDGGDVFLRAEIAELHKVRPDATPLRTLAVSREDTRTEIQRETT